MQTGGFSFITVAMYALFLSGFIVGVFSGVYTASTTGDMKPLIENTLGQVLYWDSQIYSGIHYLKDPVFMNSLSDSFREEFRVMVRKEVLFYLAVFLLVGYGLYKLGEKIAGQRSDEAITKLAIIGVIILLFGVAEFAYGSLMHKEMVVPYHGLALFVHKDTYTALFNGHATTQPSIPQNSTVVNLGGGSA